MLTTLQAAELLGVSVRRIQAMITSGRLPAEKLGRDWMIDKKDLRKLKHRKAGRPKK